MRSAALLQEREEEEEVNAHCVMVQSAGALLFITSERI